MLLDEAGGQIQGGWQVTSHQVSNSPRFAFKFAEAAQFLLPGILVSEMMSVANITFF